MDNRNEFGSKRRARPNIIENSKSRLNPQEMTEHCPTESFATVAELLQNEPDLEALDSRRCIAVREITCLLNSSAKHSSAGPDGPLDLPLLVCSHFNNQDF